MSGHEIKIELGSGDQESEYSSGEEETDDSSSQTSSTYASADDASIQIIVSGFKPMAKQDALKKIFEDERFTGKQGATVESVDYVSGSREALVTYSNPKGKLKTNSKGNLPLIQKVIETLTLIQKVIETTWFKQLFVTCTI